MKIIFGLFLIAIGAIVLFYGQQIAREGWEERKRGQQQSQLTVKEIPSPTTVPASIPPQISPQKDPWKEYDPPLPLDRPLVPGLEPDLPNVWNRMAPDGAVKIYFGSSMSFIKARSETCILQVKGTKLVSLKKIGSNAYVSAIFMDADGKIAAEMVDNRFKLNLDDSYTIQRPDDHELLVMHRGRRLLQARYLNSSSIRLAGSFKVPGFPTIEVTSNDILIDGKPWGFKNIGGGDNEVFVHID